MSADNGCYVLETMSPDGKGCEYRVIHATGIENICYNVASGEYQADFIPQEAFSYFGDAPVFTNKDDALVAAHRIADQIPVLEYGVSILDHSHQIFKTFSEEEMEFYRAEVENQIKRHRQERDAAFEAKRKEASVSFREGMHFEPAVVYGYLVKEDGTKVHGMLAGIKHLVGALDAGSENGISTAFSAEGENVEFLPSDWNDRS
jgi:hypothetical protein